LALAPRPCRNTTGSGWLADGWHAGSFTPVAADAIAGASAAASATAVVALTVARSIRRPALFAAFMSLLPPAWVPERVPPYPNLLVKRSASIMWRDGRDHPASGAGRSHASAADRRRRVAVWGAWLYGQHGRRHRRAGRRQPRPGQLSL